MSEEKSFITQSFIDSACERLKENKPLRRKLPRWGRVHIDRQLPFLSVYRLPGEDNDAGTKRLVYGEASYIVAPGDSDYQEGLVKFLREIAMIMSEKFDAFLLVEIWSQHASEKADSSIQDIQRPEFTIVSSKPGDLTPTVEALKNRLSAISINRHKSIVNLHYSESIAPDGLQPLFPSKIYEKINCYTIGLGVKAIYQDEKAENVYPFEFRALHRGITKALKKGFFAFIGHQTNIEPSHYNVLGRRRVTKVVWEVDRKLAEIDDRFDFLLQVTPVNTKEAWSEFKEGGYKKTPHFYYRPRPFDPSIVKRQLFRIPIEKIEDPTLMQLFCEKRDELDRKLTMLDDRETPNFLYGSMQTYGTVSPELLDTAHQMLSLMPAKDRQNIESDSDIDTVTAEEFAHRAEKELEYYKRRYPSLQSKVELREDIVSGAMVSRGNFLVSKWSHFPKGRVEALLHHEIGTHIVTYVNGLSQPFRQLHTGLAGYDEMQEGIAVLSEYLCGGLNSGRLRILAGRVVAANCLVEGSSFVETFHTLQEKYGFKPRTSYTITTRIFRGGGLTKDAVYLRGLVDILKYIVQGGDLDPLLVGKLSARDIPIIEELQWRKILHKAPLYPRYLTEPAAKEKLDEIRKKGLTILDLTKRSL